MRSVELFAGVGGLGMGVTQAGFTQELAIENNLRCIETLSRNIQGGVETLRDWKLVGADVRSMNFSPLLGKIDLLTGGPPCQPFSLGGKHQSRKDSRDMFPEAIRAVKEIKPKAFIFENVRGLTRNKFSNYFEYIKLRFCFPDITLREHENWLSHLQRLEQHKTAGGTESLKYNVISRVLNSANFGVPQKRERVFIVGFRSDLHCNWHFPNGPFSRDALLWEQYNGNYWEKHKVTNEERVLSDLIASAAKKIKEKPAQKPWVTVRDILSGLPEPQKKGETENGFFNHQFIDGARIYPGHTGSHYDEPSKTLKAGNHGVPGGENMLRHYDGSVRYFSMRECARLQSFPDDFIFYNSWSETVRQIGNAVPVQLAEVLASSVRDTLIEES